MMLPLDFVRKALRIVFYVLLVSIYHVNFILQVSSSPVVISPLFDPHLPGALVMPRPGQKHQVV